MSTQLETFQLLVHYLKEVYTGADAYDSNYALDEVARRFTFYTKNSMRELVCDFIDELGAVYKSLPLSSTVATKTISVCNVCGIDFSGNHGIGNILDVSVGGSTKYTIDNIIQETGAIAYPTTAYTNYGNLKVVWGNISSMSAYEKHIIGCLYTWWIPLSLDMIRKSLALGIDEKLDLNIAFSNDPVGTFIYVSGFGSSLNDSVTGSIRKPLTLNIPKWLLSYIKTSDYSGIVSYNGNKYLDKIVLFEMSKMVCSINIKQFSTDLQSSLGWFIDGIASCVTGETESILPFFNICVDKGSIDKCIFYLGDLYPANNDNSKYVGFMFFRYLAKKYSTFEVSTTQNSNILCERGEVSNYDELSKKIMKFFIKGNVKVNEWELLDDSYDSFLGATLGIPLEHREVDTSFNKKITIIADSLVLNYYDNLEDGKNHVNLTNRLDLVLKHTFPNATVNVVFNTHNRLQFVYDYITTRDLDTDYLIFNGINYEYLMSNSINTLSSLIVAITYYCKGKNIITVAIDTPCRLIGSANALQECAWCTELYDYYISFWQELCRRYGNNVFNEMLDTSKTLSSISYDTQYNPKIPARDNSKYSYSSDNYSDMYKKKYYNLLIRYVMDRVFGKGLFEVYFSFVYQNITSGSYAHWLRDMNEYMSEEYDHSTVDRVVMPKHGSGNRENAFRNTGEFIAIGLHTSFDMNLWMCEQGDITCNYEEDKQINDIKLLQAHEFRQGHPTKAIDLPYYPTTGCPWITHSTQDMSNFHISATNKIVYYFTKHSHGGTITVRFHDAQKKENDAWQSVQFGAAYQVRGNLNLYVAGGNQALSPESWTYYKYSHHEGLSYDLSIQNIALSNSNILTPTQLHKANMSNYRVFSSGKWRDYYKYSQDYKTVRYFSFIEPPPIWEVPLEEPTSYSNVGMNKAFVDTYLANYCEDKYKSSVSLHRLYMSSEESVDDKNPQVSFSAIPYAYSTNSLTLSEGINKIDGEYYLAISNGWEDRLWWYKWYCGAVYMKPWENRDVLDDITPRISELIQKKMQEKLVLDFSDDKLCYDTNYVDVKTDYHKNVLLALDIETAESFDTLYFTGYKNLKNNDLTVIYNDSQYVNVSKEDSDNNYVKTFKSDGTNKIHIEVLFNDDVINSVQICDYATQYRNIHAEFNNSSAILVSSQDFLRDINLFNGVCCMKTTYDFTSKKTYTKLVAMSKYNVTLGDVFMQATGSGYTYLYSYLYNKDFVESLLYIPHSNNYSYVSSQPKTARILEFSKIVFGDGHKDNLCVYTPRAKAIYMPPTMNIIDFGSFDGQTCDIFAYSNLRLVLYNVGIFKCPSGYDISSLVASTLSNYGFIAARLKIHVRKVIYDYIAIDYSDYINSFVPDISS